MSDHIQQILPAKIAAAVEAAPPSLTRRDAALPSGGAKGKAIAVIGMRRAGKTSFLHQCRADLLAAGRPAESLVYFNFEDERLGGMEAEQLHHIPETHARLYPEAAAVGPVTLFLDEIQVVPGWEVFVRRMLDTPGYQIFLSGSSAKLLSREIATSMRGRAWEIAIHPFSFREYLRHHGHPVPAGQEELARLTSRKATAMDARFAAYLASGGFPEAQEPRPGERRQLLQGYVDVVLLRDVIERHEVSNPTALRWLMRRLLGSPAGLFSVTGFAADLKSQGITAARETLYAYLDHLEDSFLFHTLAVATDSEKRRQVNPRKVYPADSALVPTFDRSGRSNLSHLLETAVCVELLRRGAELAYVKTSAGFEVDFRARHPDHREELVQVAASVDDTVTLAREVRALENAATELPGKGVRRMILTAESRLPFPEVPAGILLQPAWHWMLAT